MNNECKHGQLARSCELCEKDARIAELEKALQWALSNLPIDGDAPPDDVFATFKSIPLMDGCSHG